MSTEPSELLRLPLLDWIEPEDRDILAKLAQLGESNVVLFRRVVESSDYTNDMLDRLLSVAADLQVVDREYTPGGADLIAAMPFLETIDPWDEIALESMKRMARNDHLRTVMQHPAIQDGITDDEAKIVATLHSVMKYNPDLLNKLLNKKRVHLEERIIELPLAGKTWLTIIRTKTGWQQSMDYLENAVRSIEQFMSSPFPTNHVVLLFENAHDPRAGGGYFGTHAVLDADLYDSAGRSADWRASIIAHEIAHYYWHGHDESWIIEGSAEMLRIITEQHRTGRPIETYQTNCVDLYISDLVLQSRLPLIG